MKHGVTHTDTRATLHCVPFDVPKGTKVVYGAPDCDGTPFEAWTLSGSDAARLSGNAHDAAYRFARMDPASVTEGGIAVRVETFGPFNLRDTGPKSEYDALRERLKARKRFRVWAKDRSARIPAGVYIVETAHLFDNQCNTVEGARIFDFVDYSAHPDVAHIRYGHYIVDTSELDAARDLRAKCGYCGHSEDGAAGQWCTKCRNTEYLKPEHYSLLRMLPVSSDAKRDKEPPQDVLEDIRAAQSGAASARAEKAIAAKLATLEQKVLNAEYEAEFIRECVARGLHTHVIENLIYYPHVNKLCFGWRNPLAQDEVDAIRAALADVWHMYDVQFKQSGKGCAA